MESDPRSSEAAETQLPHQAEDGGMSQALVPSTQFAANGAAPEPPLATAEPKEADLSIDQFVDKTDTGVCIAVPLEFLRRQYYCGLRPLLHTPATSDEESVVEEGEPADNDPQQDRPDEKEDGQHQPAEAAIAASKRSRRKSKKRKPIGPDAEYDFEDPFIDDADANEQGYVSIFDLMAGRMDSFADIDESEEAEQSDNEDQAKVVKFSTSTVDRAKDFFVYQGPLVTSKNIERDFERPRAKKKRKRLQPAKRASPAKKSPSRKRPAQQQADGNATDEDAKVKKRRSRPGKKPPLDALAEGAIETRSSAEPLLSNAAASSDSMPKEIESPPAGKSPEKAKRTPSDSEKIVSEALFAKELVSFRKAAQGVPIESNKFPAVLRGLMDSLLLALARTMPHMSAVTYTIPGELLSQLSAILPFSEVALNRVICKKILPILIESVKAKVHPLYGELRLRAAAEQARAAPAGPALDAAEGAPPTGRPAFRFDEKMRQTLFDIIRHESDLILLRNIHARWQQLDPDHAPAAPPLVSYASPTTRKNLYKKILSASFAGTAVTSSMLSTEYGAVKRRQDRQCMREAAKMDAGTGKTSSAAAAKDAGREPGDACQVIDVVQE